MKLLVDAGNTRLKWCLDQNLNDVHYVLTTSWTEVLPQWQKSAPASVWVSSVLSEQWQEQFAELCLSELGIKPNFVEVSKINSGIQLVYKDSNTFGVDRLLAMVAAKVNNPSSNLVVISAGSAVTVDLLDATGMHFGGLIAPGVRMSFNSLGQQTDRIGQHKVTLNPNWQLGDATLACVVGGVSALFAGFIQQILAQTKFDGEYKVVVSGGDAEALALLMPQNTATSVQPYLVLQGLNHCIQNNNQYGE